MKLIAGGFFLILILLLAQNDVINCAQIQRRDISVSDPYYDGYGARNTAENCCYITSCNSDQCKETYFCGYLCTKQGINKQARIIPTPGYKLKKTYEKHDCHFGSCQTYAFLCKDCPDPYKPEFSIHMVSRNCLNCYEKY